VPDKLEMLDIFNASRPLDAIVGWRADKPIRRNAFLATVSAWQDTLSRTKGQKFALYLSDSIDFAAALLGAWHAGKTVYLAADTLPTTCAALGQLVDGYLGEFPAECQPMTSDLSDARDHGHQTWRSVPLDPKFVGLVVFTSGSTGTAQAIPKKLIQLAAEVETLESLLGERMQAADVVATVSHQHIYGLLFKVLWPLTAGRAIHALSIPYPEELAAELAQRDCVLVSSPAHLKRLPDTPIWQAVVPRLKVVFSSGGPLPLDVAHVVTQLLGQAPVEIYGSSETGGIAWRQREVQLHAQTEEDWTPLPGVSWAINEQEGVLQVRSRHLPNHEDWFSMSDCAVAVDAGRFQLQGRVDRIVKIEEKRVSLDAIEKRLKASPLVADARVLVLDGQQTARQRVAAVVALSDEGRRHLTESGKLALNRLLRDWLGSTVEAVALPRSWRYLDTLPVNAQGKTTYAMLLALLDQNMDASNRPRFPNKRLIEHAENRVLYELNVPRDLFYFDGHFPQVPILAGVVQIDWVIAIAREHFVMPAAFRGLQALKFQRVIRPEMPVQLEIVFDKEKSTLTFGYQSPAGQHASGRIQFGMGDA
jgi:acyl-coenzyme A synthetase/AMP-(fatty) acid ligase